MYGMWGVFKLNSHMVFWLSPFHRQPFGLTRPAEAIANLTPCWCPRSSSHCSRQRHSLFLAGCLMRWLYLHSYWDTVMLTVGLDFSNLTQFYLIPVKGPTHTICHTSKSFFISTTSHLLRILSQAGEQDNLKFQELLKILLMDFSLYFEDKIRTLSIPSLPTSYLISISIPNKIQNL